MHIYAHRGYVYACNTRHFGPYFGDTKNVRDNDEAPGDIVVVELFPNPPNLILNVKITKFSTR